MACDGCGCGAVRVVQYSIPTDVKTENASFEEPRINAPGVNIAENDVPGWQTDDPSNRIEMWRDGGFDGGGGGSGYDGDQYIEINYLADTRIWQTLDVPEAAGPITWEWAHRARAGSGPNIARFWLGDASLPDYLTQHEAVSVSSKVANDTTWTFYQGVWNKPAGVTQIVVSLESILPSGSLGNLVDAVRLAIVTYYTARVERCRGQDPEFRYFDTKTDEELSAEEVATIRSNELEGLGIPGFD